MIKFAENRENPQRRWKRDGETMHAHREPLSFYSANSIELMAMCWVKDEAQSKELSSVLIHSSSFIHLQIGKVVIISRNDLSLERWRRQRLRLFEVE